MYLVAWGSELKAASSCGCATCAREGVGVFECSPSQWGVCVCVCVCACVRACVPGIGFHSLSSAIDHLPQQYVSAVENR